MVASLTMCRATPQMGDGMREEAAVGGSGNPHEEEEEEEGSEDEGEEVDLEKVRANSQFVSARTSLFSSSCILP